ncbi:DUF790 family protein [Novipirellula caenicola]|uniref:DUF790 family protein n=1 Tax=Novipirellula caenicola TaxID=1536901 RepID=A0ABP9W3N8_9BACT
MLTKEQSIVEYDFSRQRVIPDRLTRSTHGHYPPLAEEMLKIYQDHVGEVRKHLHELVRRLFRGVTDCPAKRISAFCKLLDDASEFHQDKSAAAAKLRQRVFTLAASKHPLVQSRDQLFDHEEANAKAEIAAEIGKSWAEIEASLFADVIEFHRLQKPPENLDAAGLLSRYNVAQTQAALYAATSMTVWAGDDFKMILRYAKLARLMHSITRQGDRYVFQLNGPASLLRQTRRYGVAFARFLPGLLAAQDWRMQATVLGPAKRRFALRLSSSDGLRSEVQPSDFDSQIEETFWQQWQTMQAEDQTGGWQLRREGTVLHQGQTVFTPDFSLDHPEHGEVLLEVIGFWTPEYLSEKVIRLKQFQHTARIMLAISESVDQAIPDLGMPRVTFKTTLKVKEVLQILPR